MAPLPKRRHSTRRSGKRGRISLARKLASPNICSKCGHAKLTHRVCSNCGFYR